MELIRKGKKQFKIGQSKNLRRRISQYCGETVLRIEAFVLYEPPLKVERMIKQKLGEKYRRINLDNEFFDADYEGAMTIVKDVLNIREVPSRKRKNVDSEDEPPAKRRMMANFTNA